MLIYNLITRQEVPIENCTLNPAALYFVRCDSDEILQLQSVFHFDESTLIDCMNFDENTRMNSFAEYDFISMIYFALVGEEIILSEINLYIGTHYVVLVLQGGDSVAESLAENVWHRVSTSIYEPEEMNKLYFAVLDVILTDLSETMECVEDRINDIENLIVSRLHKGMLPIVTRMRENVYKLRKHLRSLIYIGDQLIVDENNLIRPENIRYFKSIDTRMNKLHDFSTSLQEYANQLFFMYESRMTMQTNEIVNKLTVITLLFAPLTVITGIYGMNFSNMPELNLSFGYPMVLILMLLVSGISLYMLKIKKWL